jgi:hypothetical protein
MEARLVMPKNLGTAQEVSFSADPVESRLRFNHVEYAFLVAIHLHAERGVA